MIQHNIKQSVRGMMKNKTFTFLNMLGFAMGFAVSLVMAIYIYKEYSVDKFFPDYQQIYRLVDADKNTSSIDRDVIPQLQSQFPEIEMITPVIYRNGKEQTVASNDNNTKISDYIFSDNSFFKLAGLKTLLSSSSVPFADENSIVLSQSTAMKLFGTTDVLNQTVKAWDKQFTISAVVENLENSSLSADLYVHQANKNINIGQDCKVKPCYFMRKLYMKLHENTDVELFTQTLNANFPANRTNTTHIKLQPLKSIYFSERLKDAWDKTVNKPMLWILSTIAILILLMSIFNYANYNISRQMKTFKSTGVKITYGASFAQIRRFYIIEVTVFVLLAFILSLLFTALLLPTAAHLLDTKLSFNWLLQPKLSVGVLLLLMMVIALSSFAPIFFTSRISMQKLFGKSRLTTNRSPVKQLMTIVQLTVSIILLTGLFVVNKQLNMVKTANYGFEKEHLLYINIPYTLKQKNALKSEFEKLPFIKDISLSSHAPGTGLEWWPMKNKNNEDVNIYVIYADNDFLKTFDISLLQGRKFRDGDLDKSVYLTANAYQALGWETLEDTKFTNHQSIGIVNNLNINSLHSDALPIAIKHSTKYSSELNIKLMPGNLSEQMAVLQQTWRQFTSNNEIFNYNFFDQMFDAMYKKEDKQAKVLSLFSIIAFVITCLGLLGQILQTTQNRIKEIGIRKINGATIKEVVALLNNGFVVSVVIAFVIATPIAYYAMNKWLENFAYKTTLSWWIFALAGLSALVIALLTVSWQSYRAASRNPVEALRYE